MKCMICSNVEGKGKFLSSKLDTLHKHVGWKKTIVGSIGIVVGDWYKESTCKKREALCR